MEGINKLDDEVSINLGPRADGGAKTCPSLDIQVPSLFSIHHASAFFTHNGRYASAYSLSVSEFQVCCTRMLWTYFPNMAEVSKNLGKIKLA